MVSSDRPGGHLQVVADSIFRPVKATWWKKRHRKLTTLRAEPETLPASSLASTTYPGRYLRVWSGLKTSKILCLLQPPPP